MQDTELIPQISAEERAKLDHHYRLLVEWNQKINLVSRKSIDLAFPQHFVDSLHVAKMVEEFPEMDPIVDVGSGAGFPGIAVAIHSPHRHVFLFEKLMKRLNFLVEVVKELKLENVEVAGAYTGVPDEGLFMARAVFPKEELFPFFKKNIKPGSILLTQLGSAQTHPAMPSGFEKIREAEYELPAAQGRRRIEVFKRVPRGT